MRLPLAGSAGVVLACAAWQFSLEQSDAGVYIFLVADDRNPRFSSDDDGPPKGTVRVIVNQSACEHTGVCEQVCPEDVFLHENMMTRVIRAHNCTYCWICVEQCVSGAITLD